MRSYVNFRTEQLTESIDYLDHRDALRTHLEILKLQLLETAKLPSLFSENILDETEYNRFRAEDHKFNAKIIESVINFAADNLYDELVNEVDAPIAPTGPTADPKILLTQLKDSLIKKVRKLMHDLRDAVTKGIEAGRSPDDTGATATAGGTPTGSPTTAGGSTGPTGSSSGGGAPMGGPSGSSSGGGAPMGGPAPTGHSGPGGRSPMDTRPAWGSPRGHEYEGGFRPANYGSFKPSDGWMGGLRRTVIDPLMNSRPIKWLRRKWHGDPQRENALVLGRLFIENTLDIAKTFADAEENLIGWINQNIQDIAMQMGFDLGAMNPATGTEPETDDGQPAPSVGMGEKPDGEAMPQLAQKAAQGDKTSKIKWEYMKDAIKHLGLQFNGEDRAGVYQVGKKKGKDKEGYVNLLNMIHNEKGSFADQFSNHSGPALKFLVDQIYPKVFGQPTPHRNALGKLQEKLQCATGSTHHDINALLQAYGKWLHHRGTPEAAAGSNPVGPTPAGPADTGATAPADVGAGAATTEPESKLAMPTGKTERTPEIYSKGDAASSDPKPTDPAKEKFKTLARASHRAKEIAAALKDEDVKAEIRNNLQSMTPEETLSKLLAQLDAKAAPAPSVGMGENPAIAAKEAPPAPPQDIQGREVASSTGWPKGSEKWADTSKSEPLQTATAEPETAPAPEDDIPPAPPAEEEESEEDVMNNFNADAQGLDIPRMVDMIKSTIQKYGREIDARKLQALIDRNIKSWQADPETYPSARDEEDVARELGATLVGDAFREYDKSQYEAKQAKAAQASALPPDFKMETFRDKLNRFKSLLNEQNIPKKSPAQLLREHLSLN